MTRWRFIIEPETISEWRSNLILTGDSFLCSSSASSPRLSIEDCRTSIFSKVRRDIDVKEYRNMRAHTHLSVWLWHFVMKQRRWRRRRGGGEKMSSKRTQKALVLFLSLSSLFNLSCSIECRIHRSLQFTFQFIVLSRSSSLIRRWQTFQRKQISSFSSVLWPRGKLRVDSPGKRRRTKNTRTHTDRRLEIRSMAHAFDNRNFIPIKQPTFRRVVSPLRSNGGQSDPTVNPQYQTYSTPLTIEYPNRGRTEMFSDMKPPAINRIARMTSTTNNNYIRRPTIQSTPISNGLTMNTTYLNTTQLYISQPVQPQLVSSSPMTLLQNTSEANQRNSITIPDFNSSPCSSPVLGQAIYRSPVPSSSFVAHHHQVVDDRRLSLEETTREYFGRNRTLANRVELSLV